MAYKVPFIDPKLHYQNLKAEIDGAIQDCLCNGDLIYRHQLREFEKDLAEFVGVKYAVGLNSGYHALLFALMGIGVGPGDEVITVAHTFVATVSAIIHCGATPILIDVAPDYNIDADRIEAAITPRTKALLPVHLNGRVAAMDQIMSIARRHRISVVEDAAQALGATFNGQMAGSMGAAGCFSFYPFKVLGGFGDGGSLTTNDPQVAQMASRLRYNGEDRETGEYHYHGQTALLDNVQAAVLSVKLRHLPVWLKHRRGVAERYRRGLSGINNLALPHFPETGQWDIFQNYVIRTRARDRLREYLREAGVETLVHWPKPMWEHRGLGLKNPGLPETEAICREVISLPMSAETTFEQVDYTTGQIREFFSRRGPDRS
ncbi:DegT/DnrJ/EryC1/StrS family aminotransferase [Candidatus Binatus sp.]|jgi:dTDP-4-amino-4,6-dideoxygalactose transaminase|uniref:DegT/DnrJ/EryC1/StrS family aminotransferase n=1 Tax=Candidatus Binatus sp. TaxID=2811406 RepID=UPI003BEA380B